MSVDLKKAGGEKNSSTLIYSPFADLKFPLYIWYSALLLNAVCNVELYNQGRYKGLPGSWMYVHIKLH